MVPTCSVTLALGLAGCEEELGPERFPTASVSGVIVEGGKPVAGGWVEFIPVDGTRGNQRSARIGPDGGFHADRVAVGRNALRLVNAPIQMPRGSALFGQYTTPLRRVVGEHLEAPLKIDLLEEAARYQANRPRPVTAERGTEGPGAAP